MDESENVLKLEHRHRPMNLIDSDIAEVCTEIDDGLARRKTINAGIKEEIDAARETYKHLMDERRKAAAVQRVIHRPEAKGAE